MLQLKQIRCRDPKLTQGLTMDFLNQSELMNTLPQSQKLSVSDQTNIKGIIDLANKLQFCLQLRTSLSNVPQIQTSAIIQKQRNEIVLSLTNSMNAIYKLNIVDNEDYQELISLSRLFECAKFIKEDQEFVCYCDYAKIKQVGIASMSKNLRERIQSPELVPNCLNNEFKLPSFQHITMEIDNVENSTLKVNNDNTSYPSFNKADNSLIQNLIVKLYKHSITLYQDIYNQCVKLFPPTQLEGLCADLYSRALTSTLTIEFEDDWTQEMEYIQLQQPQVAYQFIDPRTLVQQCENNSIIDAFKVLDDNMYSFGRRKMSFEKEKEMTYTSQTQRGLNQISMDLHMATNDNVGQSLFQKLAPPPPNTSPAPTQVSNISQYAQSCRSPSNSDSQSFASFGTMKASKQSDYFGYQPMFNQFLQMDQTQLAQISQQSIDGNFAGHRQRNLFSHQQYQRISRSKSNSTLLDQMKKQIEFNMKQIELKDDDLKPDEKKKVSCKNKKKSFQQKKTEQIIKN